MSILPPMDLGVMATRMEPRSASSRPRESSRSTQEEAGALSFSGILEEKQELQKPRVTGQEQISNSDGSAETGTPTEESAAAPGKGTAPAGNETSTTASLNGTAVIQTTGQETTSSTAQTMAVPMTELMLRIKTGEISAQPQTETGQISEAEAAKALVTAQARGSGPSGATLEIQPTAGEGKAVPAPMMEPAKTAPTASSASPLPATKAEASLQPIASSVTAATVKADQTGAEPPAVVVSESGEESSPSTDSELQPTTEAMVSGQVSLKDVKVTEGEGRIEASTGEAQGTSVSHGTVTETLATEGPAAGSEDSEESLPNPAQLAEQNSTQAASKEHSNVSASPVEQDMAAAPLTTSTPAHPVDESGFKVTAERATSPNQAQDIRQQVVRQLSTSLDGKIGQEKVVLQLNPEKLGQVEIQFVAKGNDLNIVISAQSGEAEKAIREGIRDLASGISDKSTRWQQVDIKVENRGQEPDKNETRNEERRDQSRQEQNASHQQENQHRRPDGRPDWASLRGKG